MSAASFFDVAIERVLGHEGGYSNDPRDPGGETQWGISKRSYPHLNIKALNRQAAIGIYRTDFWGRIHGDELNRVIAFLALDFAVNSGTGTAIRKLQAALGVADDGHWGPVTRGAAAAADPGVLALRYTAQRIDFTRSLKNWPTHGRGWAGRWAGNCRHAADDILTMKAKP